MNIIKFKTTISLVIVLNINVAYRWVKYELSIEWVQCWWTCFRIKLEDGYLKKCLEDSKQMSPEERGEMLLNMEGVISAHNNLAQEGQTEVICDWLHNQLLKNIKCTEHKKCMIALFISDC